MLRQIVGDVEPRRLAAHEGVACRPDRWIIENGQRDAVLRRDGGELGGAFPDRSGPVDDRGAAFAAEPAKETALAFVILDELFAPQPSEIFGLHSNAAAEGRTVLLAAVRTVAVHRSR